MNDPYGLERFVEAQRPVFDDVVAELERGRKRSHWMWFVFPQIEGLGHSAMAVRYAIGSLEEAKAYLAHDVLGPRLRRVTNLVMMVEGRTIGEIFGQPDDMKFKSSMTLFAKASPGDVFDAAIAKPSTVKRTPRPSCDWRDRRTKRSSRATALIASIGKPDRRPAPRIGDVARRRQPGRPGATLSVEPEGFRRRPRG